MYQETKSQCRYTYVCVLKKNILSEISNKISNKHNKKQKWMYFGHSAVIGWIPVQHLVIVSKLMMSHSWNFQGKTAWLSSWLKTRLKKAEKGDWLETLEWLGSELGWVLPCMGGFFMIWTSHLHQRRERSCFPVGLFSWAAKKNAEVAASKLSINIKKIDSVCYKTYSRVAHKYL